MPRAAGHAGRGPPRAAQQHQGVGVAASERGSSPERAARCSDAPAALLQNTIAYAGAPIQSLTATFLLANYAESTTLKWFVQPSLASPTVWYGPFPQVVNVHG